MQHILLDLDGTLTDPKLGIHRCIRYALDKLNCPLDPNLNIDWTIGPPLKASLSQLLNSDDQDLAEQALTLYRERFSEIGLFENQVYDGVKETIEILVDSGFILYLATAKPIVYAQQILEHFGLIQYFKKAYGSELNGDRTNKGDLIASILEQEQLDPKNCLMVGDRKYDILGA